MRKLILLVMAFVLLLVPATAEAHNASSNQVAVLQWQNTVLKSQLKAQKVYASKLRSENTSLRRANRSIEVELLTALVTRDQALAGLPTAIKALNSADFYRLVFVPAFEVYRCDTYTSTNSNWSFTFNKTC